MNPKIIFLTAILSAIYIEVVLSYESSEELENVNTFFGHRRIHRKCVKVNVPTITCFEVAVPEADFYNNSTNIIQTTLPPTNEKSTCTTTTEKTTTTITTLPPTTTTTTTLPPTTTTTTTLPPTTTTTTTLPSTTTTTTTKKPISSVLYPGECLKTGEYIESPNKCFRAYYQIDGNFVNYRMSNRQALWNSRTPGTCPNELCMQTDGNFAIYDCNNITIMQSWNGKPGARLVLQDQGNMVVYSPSNVALWYTTTNTTPC